MPFAFLRTETRHYPCCRVGCPKEGTPARILRWMEQIRGSVGGLSRACAPCRKEVPIHTFKASFSVISSQDSGTLLWGAILKKNNKQTYESVIFPPPLTHPPPVKTKTHIVTESLIFPAPLPVSPPLRVPPLRRGIVPPAERHSESESTWRAAGGDPRGAGS